jgi:hypothetical protein
VNSVGRDNFEWVVNAVAEMALKKALSEENPARELHWASFLQGEAGPGIKKKAAKKTAQKSAPVAGL